MWSASTTSSTTPGPTTTTVGRRASSRSISTTERRHGREGAVRDRGGGATRAAGDLLLRAGNRLSRGGRARLGAGGVPARGARAGAGRPDRADGAERPGGADRRPRCLALRVDRDHDQPDEPRARNAPAADRLRRPRGDLPGG